METNRSSAPHVVPVADREEQPTAPCELCPTRSACTARGLDAAGLDALSALTDTSRPLAQGAPVYRAGDPSDGWYVVRSGAIRTSVLTRGGNEHVTAFVFPGELLGVSGQADGQHHDDAVALTSSTVCRIHADDLATLLQIGAGESFLRLLGEQQARDQLLEVNLRQSSAEARIAGFVTLLGERLARLGFRGDCVPLPMSRTDLANYLGMSLECLSRILGRWKRAGWIELNRNELIVREADQLAAHTRHLPG